MVLTFTQLRCRQRGVTAGGDVTVRNEGTRTACAHSGMHAERNLPKIQKSPTQIKRDLLTCAHLHTLGTRVSVYVRTCVLVCVTETEGVCVFTGDLLTCAHPHTSASRTSGPSRCRPCRRSGWLRCAYKKSLAKEPYVTQKRPAAADTHTHSPIM